MSKISTDRSFEITVKFTEKPIFEGDSAGVVLTVEGEGGMSVVAELKRKTLNKQLKKMSELENWVGAISGKLRSISSDKTIKLEGAGIQVFEVKKKEPKTEEIKSPEQSEKIIEQFANAENISLDSGKYLTHKEVAERYSIGVNSVKKAASYFNKNGCLNPESAVAQAGLETYVQGEGWLAPG